MTFDSPLGPPTVDEQSLHHHRRRADFAPPRCTPFGYPGRHQAHAERDVCFVQYYVRFNWHYDCHQSPGRAL